MRRLSDFVRDRGGNFAMLGAILSIPLLLSVGLAIDYSRYLSSNKHLQELADATALNLAASKEMSEERLREAALEYIQANRNPSRLTSVAIADLVASADDVDLSLRGEIHASFMGIAGYDRLPSAASALAERAVRGNVEVALILDNTWSMSEVDAKGVSKIATLKSAATTLVKELLQAEDGVVRIGLVPYADYVNVGLGNRGASWLDVAADYTTAPSDRVCEMKTTKTECDRYEPKTTCTRVVDGVSETYSCGGGCSPGASRTVTVPAYESCSGGGSGTAYKWYGCVGSRMSSDTRLHDRNPGVRYPGYVETSHKCPTPIVPLSAKKATLLPAIDQMIINRGTGYRPYTYIPAGLVWGLNVLSPGQPFEDAGAYDPGNQKPRKVAVLMTDGENTLRFRASDGRHIATSGTEANKQAQLAATNKDTLALCAAMKAQKIEIFTVAFMVDDPTAKAMLESCASGSANYYDAGDSDSLLAAFSGIGASLRVVRLAR